MSLVKLKEKGQVTIPVQLRQQLSARPGDLFEVTIADGNIVLKPQDVTLRPNVAENSEKPGVDISDYIGSAKGIFTSPYDVDAYISAARAQWE